MELYNVTYPNNTDLTYYSKLTTCVPEMNCTELNDQRLLCKECCDIIDIVYVFRDKCLKSKARLIEHVQQLRTANTTKTNPADTVISIDDSDDSVEEVFIKSEYDSANRTETIPKDDIISFENAFRNEFRENIKYVEKSLNIVMEDVDLKRDYGAENSENFQQNYNFPLGKDGNVDTATVGKPQRNYHKTDITSENIGQSLRETNNIIYPNQKSAENFLNNGNIYKGTNKTQPDNYNSESMLENFAHSTMEQNHVYSNDKPMENLQQNETIYKDINRPRANKCNSNSVVDLDEPVTEKKSTAYTAQKSREDYQQNDTSYKDNYTYQNAPIQENHSDEQSIQQVPTSTSVLLKSQTQPQQVEKAGYKCHICNIKMYDSGVYKDHMRNHEEASDKSNPQNCQGNIYSGHVNRAKERPFGCSICNRKFSLKSNLDDHLKTHTGSTRYECHICNDKFTKKNNLERHIRAKHIMDKPYECDICGKKFSAKTSLTSHIRIHTGEKPYGCPICNDHFTQKSNLIAHMRTHSDDRPFKCHICFKTFTLKKSVYKHVRVKHHTEARGYECNVCKQKFFSRSNLVVHMRKHTGERPYGCTMCPERFADYSALINHKRKHTGEKPYGCNICNKHFAYSSSLQNHLRTHENPVILPTEPITIS